MATKKKTRKTKAASKKVSKKVSSKKVAKKVAKKVTKRAVKKATKKAAKKVAKKVSKKASKKKVTKKASKKKVTKKTAKKAAKKVAKKTTKKKAAAKTTKKVSKKTATKKVAKKKNAAVKKVAAQAILNDDSLIHGIAPYKLKAREKYMNPKQLAHFRSILEAWKTNLLDEVSKTIHLMQDENINHPDPNDRASQEMDMSIELRNRDRERKLLKKIDSTILRLDADDYGWCESCGVEIGIRRLEARPTAELCIDCKTLNEIKERQMI